MTRHLSYRSLLSQERKDFVRVTGLVLFAAAIGFGYTLYLFPIPFLAGSAPWWKDAAPQDVKQTITGLRYFIANDWQFPIFRTLKVNPPEGLVIIYTDSIPHLYATPLDVWASHCGEMNRCLGWPATVYAPSPLGRGLG